MTQKRSEFISPEEASVMLHKSRRTIDRYAEAGTLTKYLREGKVLFKRSDVESLRNQKEQVTRSEA